MTLNHKISSSENPREKRRYDFTYNSPREERKPRIRRVLPQHGFLLGLNNSINCLICEKIIGKGVISQMMTLTYHERSFCLFYLLFSPFAFSIVLNAHVLVHMLFFFFLAEEMEWNLVLEIESKRVPHGKYNWI